MIFYFIFSVLTSSSANAQWAVVRPCLTCGLHRSDAAGQLKRLVITSCEASLKIANCENFYRQNEIPRDEQRSCVNDPKTLPARDSDTVASFGESCTSGIAKDMVESVEPFVSPLLKPFLKPYTDENTKEFNFLKNCQSTRCKQDLLEPFLNLKNTDGSRFFSSLKDPKIIGYNDPEKCKVIVPENQTYCQGQSAANLYRPVIEYMRNKADTTRMDQLLSVPWQEIKAVVRHNEPSAAFEALKDEAKTDGRAIVNSANTLGHSVWGIYGAEGRLAKKVFKSAPYANETVAEAMLDWLDDKNIKFTCYNNKRRLEMGCYALAAIFSAIPEGEAKLAMAVEKLSLKKEVKGAIALRKEYATKKFFSKAEEKRALKEWALKASQVDPDGKTIFFHIENTKLKLINDETSDHEFADALSNKYKDIFLQKFEAIKSDYPDLHSVPISDGKSLDFIVSSNSGKTPPDVEERMMVAFKETNKEFADFLDSQGIAPKTSKPENWYRAATADTSDQASTLARAARDQSGENVMLSYRDPQSMKLLNDKLTEFKKLDSQLTDKLQDTDLLESVPFSREFEIKTEVIGLVRKNPDITVLESLLREQYGDKAAAETKFIQAYVKAKDVFSPTVIKNIATAPRAIEVIKNAKYGVLNVDIIGQGDINIKGTGQALRISQNVTKAIKNARLQDVHITKDLEEKRKHITEALEQAFPDGSVRFKKGVTGDELSFAPSRVLTPKEWKTAVDAIARCSPTSMRSTVVSHNVKDETLRGQLGYLGETFEKNTKKNLANVLPLAKLKNIHLSVTMDGSSQKLTIIDLNPEPLSAKEEKLIQKIFKEVTSQ